MKMTPWATSRLAATLVSCAIGVALACTGGSSGAPGPSTGQSCASASQCYPTLDAAALHGQVACLTQLQGGYCTHTCMSDADCCAVPGECVGAFNEVCASFESSGQMYCFVACSPSDIALSDAGITDPNAFCQHWAGPSFTCRSTGGGSNNRKFCGP
jgi:hypothetical protein